MQDRYVPTSVNQKDIAEQLGVSIMTVSRALRNHPDLSEATRDRIISKAVELGYTKIPVRAQRSAIKRVGLYFCQEPHYFLFLGNGVMKRMFMAIEAECQKRELELVVQFLKPGDSPVAVKNGTIDAALILGRYTAETAAYFKDIPAIAVSNFIPDLKLPSIATDNMGGARLATRHLLDLGHKKIVFVGVEENIPTEIYRVRSEGYALEMLREGLKPNIVGFGNEKSSEEVMAEVLKSTGAVCCCDSSVEGIRNFVLKRGGRIPQDLSIVGYDNVTSGSEFEELTSYAPDWDQLGQMAVGALVGLSGDLLKSAFKLIVPGNLVVRNSTAKPRKTETIQ